MYRLNAGHQKYTFDCIKPSSFYLRTPVKFEHSPELSLRSTKPTKCKKALKPMLKRF